MPTEEIAGKLLEKYWLDRKVGDLFRQTSVRKTDAQHGEMFGIEIYNMECEVEIELLKDLNSTKEAYRMFSGAGRTDQHVGKRKGERIVGIVNIDFEKSEKGWKGRVESNRGVMRKKGE